MTGSIRRNVAENLRVKTGDIDADVVDGTKIADDAIDSEHYVAGSIDEEHYADDSVTNDKLYNIKTGTVSLDTYPTIAALSVNSTTLAVAGLAADDDVMVTIQGEPNTAIVISGAEASAGALKVYFLNASSAAVSEGSGENIGVAQELLWIRIVA